MQRDGACRCDCMGCRACMARSVSGVGQPGEPEPVGGVASVSASQDMTAAERQAYDRGVEAGRHQERERCYGIVLEAPDIDDQRGAAVSEALKVLAFDITARIRAGQQPAPAQAALPL